MVELTSTRAAVDWLCERVSGELRIDSREVGSGDGFIAWPGAATDGRRFVRDALARGAVACLVERDGVDSFDLADSTIGCLEGLKAATGPIACAWYGEPSERLDLLAVTGTNGKTSTAWWLAEALSRLPGTQQVSAAVMGTLGVGIVPGALATLAQTGLTTPDPVTLQRWLRRFVDTNVRACAIEASSIGLQEGRLDGSRIRVAIFTNFSQDHLDYHGSMKAYWHAKARLFAWPGLQAAIVNIDDQHGAELAQSLQRSLPDVWTVSLKKPARINAQEIELGAQGLRFTVAEGSERHRIETPLIGTYNVSNLLCAIGAMRAIGVPLRSAVRSCVALAPVPGRLERLGGKGQPLIVIDYAHTPDALAKVLGALLPLARTRGGRLHCVFGCGGDRDKVKRAPMADAAEKIADRLVVTSDNPRSEPPLAIIEQAVQGLAHPERALVEPDRARAIAGTIVSAAACDVICIAGKGHETYQEILGVRHPFSDPFHAATALAQRAAMKNEAIKRDGACT